MFLISIVIIIAIALLSSFLYRMTGDELQDRSKLRKVSYDPSDVSSGLASVHNTLRVLLTEHRLNRPPPSNDPRPAVLSLDLSSIATDKEMDDIMAPVLEELKLHDILTGTDNVPTYNNDIEDDAPNLVAFQESNDPELKNLVGGGVRIYVANADDEAFAKENLRLNIKSFHCNWLMTWPNLYVVLIALLMAGGVGFQYFLARDFAATGGPAGWQYLKPLLLQIPVFERILLALEDCGVIIYTGFIGANYSGNHPAHQDNLTGDATHRMIWTLGYGHKMMWFTDLKTNNRFGIRMDQLSL